MKPFTLLLALTFFISVSHASVPADTALIRDHLSRITKTAKPRSYRHLKQLNEVADYIQSVFALYSTRVTSQEFTAQGQVYRNIICSFGPDSAARIVVGAHYDVCGEQEGADDNASGVAGLLELARMLQGQALNHRIDLVAYSLEEPPFFRTRNMGSYVHAQSLAESGVDVHAMIALEMIGYFKDEKKSQAYPVKALSLFYGTRGNYITLVKKPGAGKFVRQFCRRFKNAGTIRTKKFTAPAFIPGIDFSDHLNYWNFGFSAMMVTDTAFYRNFNYHEPTDTMATLDLQRMARVIDGVFQALAAM